MNIQIKYLYAGQRRRKWRFHQTHT